MGHTVQHSTLILYLDCHHIRFRGMFEFWEYTRGHKKFVQLNDLSRHHLRTYSKYSIKKKIIKVLHSIQYQLQKSYYHFQFWRTFSILETTTGHRGFVQLILNTIQDLGDLSSNRILVIIRYMMSRLVV